MMRYVSMFGLLKIRKSYSKAAYRVSDRILKLASVDKLTLRQHDFGFVPTTQVQIQV
ncbi:hypothetical protein [Mangrovimonas aestuarii]|uniref:hypothetical protein n=1 Tax=Mangrovimonas aestuarii TaxID=3018443 RepID=UPI0023791BDD|nr:hypothetical protein [Mangrovimonas aestuarii]